MEEVVTDRTAVDVSGSVRLVWFGSGLVWLLPLVASKAEGLVDRSPRAGPSRCLEPGILG
jgi:hypothetical protein